MVLILTRVPAQFPNAIQHGFVIGEVAVGQQVDQFRLLCANASIYAGIGLVSARGVILSKNASACAFEAGVAINRSRPVDVHVCC